MPNAREQFVEHLKQQLDELNRHVSEIEAKAEQLSGAAREELDANLDKLREHSEALVLKLNKLRQASEDSWRDLVAETERIRDAFLHSVNYFRSQL